MIGGVGGDYDYDGGGDLLSWAMMITGRGDHHHHHHHHHHHLDDDDNDDYHHGK